MVGIQLSLSYVLFMIWKAEEDISLYVISLSRLLLLIFIFLSLDDIAKG